MEEMTESYRFSQIKGVPVLTTVDPNLQQTMGQMEGPSFLDVAILNHHYKCQGGLLFLVILICLFREMFNGSILSKWRNRGLQELLQVQVSFSL